MKFQSKTELAGTGIATITTVIALMVHCPAAAQSDDQAALDVQLRACAAISDSVRRVNCYDRLAERQAAATAVPTPDDEAAESAQLDVSTPAPASKPVPRATPSPDTESPSPAATPAPAASVPAAPLPSADAPAGPPAEAAGPAAMPARTQEDQAEAEFGLPPEPVVEERPEPVEVRATIVESEKSGIYHFVVLLDNGQVWEETDGSRRIGLPKVGSPVRIYEGRLGGYRMKIGNDNRIAWVRRLK